MVPCYNSGMTDTYSTLTSEEMLALLNSNLEGLSLSAKAEVRDHLLEKVKEMAREDFYTYVLVMAPHCLPEEFTPGRHIELICKELQAIEQYVVSTRKGTRHKKPKGTGRLQIFLPPGSMKSLLAGRLFGSWLIGRHPKWRVMAVGHSREFAIDNTGRPLRDLMASEEYKEIFPDVYLSEDLKAAGRWETGQGGQFYAAGAGTRIAGRRAHIAIIDDVISEQEADSKTQRENINRWYGKGLQSRLLPGAAEIVVNTRWHINDLSGYTVNAFKDSTRPYRIISIPAILDDKASELLRKPDDPEGYLTPGTSYWPEFWPTQELLDKKNGGTLSNSDWNALYMQNPVADEGNIVKWDEFRQWPFSDPPECSYLVLSLDTAFQTTERADYTAYSLWGIFKHKETFDESQHEGTKLYGHEGLVPNMILLSAGKGKYEFPELCRKVELLYKTKRPDAILIEKKGSGQSLIQELRRRGFPVLEWTPDKDKESRLHACTPFFQSGRIWIPKVSEKRPWVREWVDEVVCFPFAEHDDAVDSTTQAILWMRDNWQFHHEKYSSFMEDEFEDRPKKKARTYWSMSVDKVAR
jgi:predicted phage terminase large subunit-like protein